MAVVTGAGPATRVVEANAAARERGIRPGTPEAEAGVPGARRGWRDEVARALARGGVATLGGRACLPRAGLAARLGSRGLAAHALARGVDDRAPWTSWAPPPFWEEAQELDWEIDALGPLVVVLGRVVERLTARLSAACLVADALELRLALAGGGHHARTLALACPMDAPRPLLTLLEHDLGARPPQGAVTAGALQASAIPRRPVAGELGRTAPPAERDLATVLARLVTLVGADGVGAVALTDSHRPDAFVPARFEPNLVPETGRDTGDAVLALRRLRPPRRVSVATDGARRPAVVCGALGPEARVIGCAAPWRVSGGWWDAGAWARDEWGVARSGGAVCRLARELRSGEWYLDGVYD